MDDKIIVKSRVAQAEDYILETFILAVGMNFRTQIIEKEPKTIQDAYALLKKLETATGVKSDDNVDEKLTEVLSLLKLKEAKENFANPEIRRVGDVVRQSPNNGWRNGNNMMECQFCGRIGHTARFCYDIPSNVNNN